MSKADRMKPVILKEWAVRGNPYQAPEVAQIILEGAAYGHPRYSDGERIITSRVVAAEGRLIHCASRDYLLDGPPQAGYLAWCREHGIPPPDEENPIRVREK